MSSKKNANPQTPHKKANPFGLAQTVKKPVIASQFANWRRARRKCPWGAIPELFREISVYFSSKGSADSIGKSCPAKDFVSNFYKQKLEQKIRWQPQTI